MLAVWREACRHIEITESVGRIAKVLSDRLPTDFFLVRRLDIEHLRLDTAAVGVCRPGPVPNQKRTNFASENLNALHNWWRAGRVLRGRTGAGEQIIDVLAPPEVDGEVLAGPLVYDGHPIGALVFVARHPLLFDEEHVALVFALLEPFSIALVNDSRLHELARLREALEADKRALLSRLDRQEVVEVIVGAESGLRSILERVEQVAPTDTPVLIFGETGSGKEVVARAIHARSSRATGPIVRVNCGALPPGLVDSELFGHERGSFTGAIASRKGWFERADGGTLFLDEVAELPLDAQVRLLRILQDGTFERVGGHRQLTVDVRIVAATHRNLQEMVARGNFREDLWYRISVFPIHLPPLRERPEDIPLLAAHFAWRAGMRLGGAPLSLSSTDIDLLVAYPWPGNVRELATVIERAAILGNGRSLLVGAALGVTSPTEPYTGRTEGIVTSRPSDDSFLQLDQAMARHIEISLTRSGGRIEGPLGAAAMLGINPHTLRARMRRLGVDWARFRAHS